MRPQSTRETTLREFGQIRKPDRYVNHVPAATNLAKFMQHCLVEGRSLSLLHVPASGGASAVFTTPQAWPRLVNTRRRAIARVAVVAIMMGFARGEPVNAAVLDSFDTRSGYLAGLLVNEAPFPGESGWVSEDNTCAAMLSILWVLHSRVAHIPQGYTQKRVAAVSSADIIDVITAGGEKGQCDGFYRNRSGEFTAVSRVSERIAYLEGIAGKGKPGRFARLLNYAQDLAKAYFKQGVPESDRYEPLKRIGSKNVTGRAYSWMTNRDYYSPGGYFVKIPDQHEGSLGGNRFFSLEKVK